QFVKSEIERRLAPIFAAQALQLEGSARGLVYQLADALGCLRIAEMGAPLRLPNPLARKALGRLGIRFGREAIYIEPLLATAALPRAAMGGEARPSGAQAARRA